jgi:hypothetical protein
MPALFSTFSTFSRGSPTLSSRSSSFLICAVLDFKQLPLQADKADKINPIMEAF